MRKRNPNSRIGQRFTQLPDGGEDIDVFCTICGKSITHSNDYGMYCDNECGIEEDKLAYKLLTTIFPFLKS